MRKILWILFVVPFFIAAQTITDIAPANYKSVVMPGNQDYTRCVILLHAIYDGEIIAKNYAAGTLLATRVSGYDRNNTAEINTSSGYKHTNGSLTGTANTEDEYWKLKKVRYNGVLYIAVEPPYRGAKYSGGFHFIGWMKSTGADAMKMVPFYNMQQNTVLHEEIYSTIEDYQPDNSSYHDYQKSVFSGNVGIGTHAPDAALTVNGKIHTKEVKVDLDGFVAPDYVFEENYQLPALDEVARYIRENRHLPGIPSAKQMETDGVNLKEMNLKLLEKVEELTLYVIGLKEENEHQQKEIEKLKKNK